MNETVKLGSDAKCLRLCLGGRASYLSTMPYGWMVLIKQLSAAICSGRRERKETGNAEQSWSSYRVKINNDAKQKIKERDVKTLPSWFAQTNTFENTKPAKYHMALLLVI